MKARLKINNALTVDFDGADSAVRVAMAAVRGTARPNDVLTLEEWVEDNGADPDKTPAMQNITHRGVKANDGT